MEAGDGSQRALQIAFQTLKERCTHFQNHIAVLEAENVKLRGQLVRIQCFFNSFMVLGILILNFTVHKITS